MLSPPSNTQVCCHRLLNRKNVHHNQSRQRFGRRDIHKCQFWDYGVEQLGELWVVARVVEIQRDSQ